jgi:cytochrome oxidase Cu insertion factor (SCO1/SenC/PrrC family)
LAGDVTLVYFGYTHCPDVCPETLAKLAQVTHQLGGAAQHIKILFVSVNPARDTPSVMHANVDAFDPQHDVGLTDPDDNELGVFGFSTARPRFSKARGRLNTDPRRWQLDIKQMINIL